MAGLITPRLLYSLLRVSDSAGLEGVAQEFAFLTGSQGLPMLILDRALGTTVIEDMVANGGRGARMGTQWREVQGLGSQGKDFVSTAYFLCILSVPIPFRGDYIGLQGNPKLQTLKSSEEGPILVAETVQKINRGNGKVKACVLNSPRLIQSLGCWLEGWGLILPFLTLSCFVPRLLLEFSSLPKST